MLSDLDELILKCPDPQSRAYIKEAIICYKNGAYRSAIVSTWIAICFDLIDKIRSLAEAGDGEAIKLNEQYDKIVASNDIVEALKFEKTLLDAAKDKLEFFSSLEYTDLKRISEDRNRCAHPSKDRDALAFAPTSELARLHIVNAAHHVLTQPPAQGKATLERLATDLQSAAFPAKPDEVRKILENGPLGRPRKALLRNYIILVLKNHLDLGAKFKTRGRMARVLTALVEIHPQQSREVLTAEVKKFINSADDESLTRIIRLAIHQEIWPLLEDTARIKLTSYVENIPSDKLDFFDELIDSYLEPASSVRLARATLRELLACIWITIPAAAASRMIRLLRFAKSSEDIAGIADYLKAYSDDILEAHIHQLMEVSNARSTVATNRSIARLLEEIGKRDDEWRSFIDTAATKAGLMQFVSL
ncbi:hypothetical protein QTI51_04150 [Variovorax sp. J22G73]|uniref:hypothetical protein n=1 Tax=unclassified Variovorax TaxID=663243 RepID=UPI002575838B|nr:MULTISPECIES: hypothetical protein [unclassified Variovorax]MDM0003879.1 hypothetical protein [Variovorax sp. J22R203]MDM0096455.1 hypothetical protein [Variovorax sp. J22G73]